MAECYDCSDELTKEDLQLEQLDDEGEHPLCQECRLKKEVKEFTENDEDARQELSEAIEEKSEERFWDIIKKWFGKLGKWASNNLAWDTVKMWVLAVL